MQKGRECEFCRVTMAANQKNSVCNACDKNLIKLEKLQKKPQPKRYCRQCKNLITTNHYFHCYRCRYIFELGGYTGGYDEFRIGGR